MRSISIAKIRARKLVLLKTLSKWENRYINPLPPTLNRVKGTVFADTYL